MARHNPFTIKPELVQGCTRRCPFCALSAVPWRDDRWHFMTPDLFHAIVDDLTGWLPKCRIEFAARGEPSFHPQLKAFAAYTRARLPQAQILLTTNGDMIRKHPGAQFVAWVREIMDAGINQVMLDCYDTARYAEMQALFPDANDFFRDFPAHRHPYGYHGGDYKSVILVDATPGNTNQVRWYHNMGGNVDTDLAAARGFPIPTVRAPLKKMCVRPFRELSIHVNGQVPICCMDWMSEGVVGTFPTHSLQELWALMDGYRARLIAKDRAALTPCYKCSERPGFRNGLEMHWFDTVPPVPYPYPPPTPAPPAQYSTPLTWTGPHADG